MEKTEEEGTIKSWNIKHSPPDCSSFFFCNATTRSTSKVYPASLYVRGHLEMVWATAPPPPPPLPSPMMLCSFCVSELRSKWSHLPKVGTICLSQQGYYSSCLRDESCATRRLTSQVGVFLCVLFLFLLNYLLCSICLWVSVVEQLMVTWVKCLSPSADFAANFTEQWFQVWRHFATALESDDSNSMKSQT